MKTSSLTPRGVAALRLRAQELSVELRERGAIASADVVDHLVLILGQAAYHAKQAQKVDQRLVAERDGALAAQGLCDARALAARACAGVVLVELRACARIARQASQHSRRGVDTSTSWRLVREACARAEATKTMHPVDEFLELDSLLERLDRYDKAVAAAERKQRKGVAGP